MATVAVLMGGRSAEREISLKTGRAVADALVRLGHRVVPIDPGADLARLLDDAAPDAVFVALHGPGGEDGTVQGLLEVLGLPYTGSGVLGSALAADKVRSKWVFEAAGIPTPAFQVLEPGDDPGAVALPAPLVAKPPAEGSTIGIAVARSAGEVAGAVAVARRHDPRVLIEAFVDGREVTLGVLDGEPLPLVEIVPEGGFYDYDAKYTPGRTRYLCPAPVEPAMARACERAGLAAYRALDCSGGARVDLMVDRAGRPWVLEVNTIPGMTPTSLLPKAAAAAGLGFDELVQKLLDGARTKTEPGR